MTNTTKPLRPGGYPLYPALENSLKKWSPSYIGRDKCGWSQKKKKCYISKITLEILELEYKPVVTIIQQRHGNLIIITGDRTKTVFTVF